jgi:allantoinase
MTTASRLDLPVAVHAEDPVALEQARATVTGHGWADYVASRPAACEGVAIRLALECAKETGCPLHIVHVSASTAVETIGWYRERGADVTCETCPHYFMLTAEDLPRIGAPAKCAPPLRDQQSAQLLISQLHSKAIDFVASDHSPARRR